MRYQDARRARMRRFKATTSMSPEEALRRIFAQFLSPRHAGPFSKREAGRARRRLRLYVRRTQHAFPGGTP